MQFIVVSVVNAYASEFTDLGISKGLCSGRMEVLAVLQAEVGSFAAGGTPDNGSVSAAWVGGCCWTES